MLDTDRLLETLGIIVVASPLVTTMLMGLASLINVRLSEESTARLGHFTIFIGLTAAVAILAIMLTSGKVNVPIELGTWVSIPEHYHFSVKIVFDRLSVPFAILSYVLSGTIGAFASQYLHREPGYNRFFTTYWYSFVLGMVVTSLAGTIETLFTGWELVGLSSVLLVAFFQERPAPPRSALWVWIVYRISDAALLLAAVAMHKLSGEGDFERLLGHEPWPFDVTTVGSREALWVGLLLVFAAAGKSGLVPFSGWLPKAMEGPTPSSAVFYGALSVHLGAFLLLRVSPLLDASLTLSMIVVALGLATAVYAHLASSVQGDIKSALSFASLTQVGIIVAEIGLGYFWIPLRYFALIHLLGHACLRTLQFVRAPSLLQDYRTLENAIGDHLPLGRLRVSRFRIWLYRWSLERGYLDALLSDYIVAPFVRVFRWCDAMERRWTDLLSQSPPPKPIGPTDPLPSPIGVIEDLP